MIKNWINSFWQPIQKSWQEGKKEKKSRKANAKLFALKTNAKIERWEIYYENHSENPWENH